MGFATKRVETNFAIKRVETDFATKRIATDFGIKGACLIQSYYLVIPGLVMIPIAMDFDFIDPSF